MSRFARFTDPDGNMLALRASTIIVAVAPPAGQKHGRAVIYCDPRFGVGTFLVRETVSDVWQILDLEPEAWDLEPWGEALFT